MNFETSTENKFSSSFGMPRTVSGNLKDVFKNYKKEGQFMRYKTPTNQGDNLHENVPSVYFSPVTIHYQ
jgi:hypothetical protein